MTSSSSSSLERGALAVALTLGTGGLAQQAQAQGTSAEALTALLTMIAVAALIGRQPLTALSLARTLA